MSKSCKITVIFQFWSNLWPDTTRNYRSSDSDSVYLKGSTELWRILESLELDELDVGIRRNLLDDFEDCTKKENFVKSRSGSANFTEI